MTYVVGIRLILAGEEARIWLMNSDEQDKLRRELEEEGRLDQKARYGGETGCAVGIICSFLVFFAVLMLKGVGGLIACFIMVLLPIVAYLIGIYWVRWKHKQQTAKQEDNPFRNPTSAVSVQDESPENLNREENEKLEAKSAAQRDFTSEDASPENLKNEKLEAMSSDIALFTAFLGLSLGFLVVFLFLPERGLDLGAPSNRFAIVISRGFATLCFGTCTAPVSLLAGYLVGRAICLVLRHREDNPSRPSIRATAPDGGISSSVATNDDQDCELERRVAETNKAACLTIICLAAVGLLLFVVFVLWVLPQLVGR